MYVDLCSYERVFGVELGSLGYLDIYLISGHCYKRQSQRFSTANVKNENEKELQFPAQNLDT